jgi:dCMP deaminase
MTAHADTLWRLGSALSSADIRVLNGRRFGARWLPVAKAMADQSKYDGTRVGAIVLGPGGETRSSGWNGAPRGAKADEQGDARLADRETRLKWAVHAEANAIAGAARAGTVLLGSTMVVTHAPCCDCAKLIVQAGIARVIAPRPQPRLEQLWGADLAIARAMFQECGVEFIELDTSEIEEAI